LRSLAATLAIVAGLIGRGAAGPTALTVVTIGTLSSDNSAAVYYAQELGIFKKYGIDAQISALASGPVTAAAVTGGALDIASPTSRRSGGAHARRPAEISLSGLHRRRRHPDRSDRGR